MGDNQGGAMPVRLRNLCVMSAPSGSGKTTLVKRLLKAFPYLRFSISTTTRSARPGEQHGHDYYYISRPEFEAKIDQDEFLEWAEVHGNLYGTSLSEIARITADGHIGILDIDIQGFRQVKSKFEEVVTVFIAPPSMEELRRRLISRGTDAEEAIQRRLRRAEEEMRFQGEFDHLIINDDLDTAFERLADLLNAMPRAT